MFRTRILAPDLLWSVSGYLAAVCVATWLGIVVVHAGGLPLERMSLLISLGATCLAGAPLLLRRSWPLVLALVPIFVGSVWIVGAHTDDLPLRRGTGAAPLIEAPSEPYKVRCAENSNPSPCPSQDLP